MLTTTSPVIGVATEGGPRRAINCDAFAHHVFHGRLAVAVVDGIGTRPDVAEFAIRAAEAATRVAARRTPVLGIISAAEQWTDLDDDSAVPSGAIVVATAEPDGVWRIAWAGDSAAYYLDDSQVARATQPHTMGQHMRGQGAPDAEARQYDHSLMNDLGRALRYGVDGIEVSSPLLVLASDGLCLDKAEIGSVLTAHPDQQHAADALLKAARAHTADDITVAVVKHPDTEQEVKA